MCYLKLTKALEIVEIMHKVACFQHTESAFNESSTCMQNSTGSMIRCYF